MMSEQVFHIVAYADGACKNNNSHSEKRLGGCGLIIQFRESKLIDEHLASHDSNICTLRSEMLKTKDFVCVANPLSPKIEPPNKFSNNRAELEAFNGVLARFVLMDTDEKLTLTIKTDSEYVIKVFNGAWKWKENDWKLASGTVAANIDYILELITFVDVLRKRGNTVKVKHVPAHQQQPDKKNKEIWLDWFFNDFADRLSNIGAGVESDINYNLKKRKK